MWARRTAQAICSHLCLRRCVWVELHARRLQPTGSGHLHGTEVAAGLTWAESHTCLSFEARGEILGCLGRKSKTRSEKEKRPSFPTVLLCRASISTQGWVPWGAHFHKTVEHRKAGGQANRKLSSEESKQWKECQRHCTARRCTMCVAKKRKGKRENNTCTG